MPSHRSSVVDNASWDAPLISGAPARTWNVLAYSSFAVTFMSFAAAFLLNVVAPQMIAKWMGAPVLAVFAFTFVAFRNMFRQMWRENSAGYTTLSRGSLRGSVPVVNPRTRQIHRHGAAVFDPVVARARAPWSARGADQSPHEFLSAPSRGDFPPTSPPTRVRGQVRWVPIAGIVLMGLGLVARVQSGTISASQSLVIGFWVFVTLLGITLPCAAAYRYVAARRLSKVTRVTSGTALCAISTPETRVAFERVNVAAGVVPMVSVLVFDVEGFSLWRGSGVPHPVVTVRYVDVLAIKATTVSYGRTFAKGLEVSVMPPDERWPVDFDFIIFDESRLFAALNEKKLVPMVDSITRMWTSGVLVSKR